MSLDVKELSDLEKMNLPLLDRFAVDKETHTGLRHATEDLELFRNYLDMHFADSKLRVLDAGCGIGRYAADLADIFSYEGVDLSGEAIRLAEEAYPHLSFSQQTFRKLNFRNGRFNGIWAACSLNTTPKDTVPEVLRELKRVLKHRGIIFLMMPNHGYSDEGVVDTDFDLSLYYASWYIDEFVSAVRSAGFTILGAYERTGGAFSIHAQKTS